MQRLKKQLNALNKKFVDNKFSYTVLCEIILKDWSFQIFTTISLLPWRLISAPDQQKRESFDNPEFLNKDFQLAKSKTRLLLTTTFIVTGISISKLNHCFKWRKIFCRLYMIRETIPGF